MVKKTIGIYYASQTGTAEGFAATLKDEAEEHELEAEVIDLAEVTEMTFKRHKYIIMLMATHYEGNPTDNAADFWSWFSREDEIPTDWLKGYKFTVFGLGDTTYVNFCKIGKETDRLMEKYGAERVYKLGIGSDDEGFISKYFKEWKKDMWPVLVQAFPMSQEQEPENKQIEGAPFVCTISSFTQEKSLDELRKNTQEFNFKASNYLNHQTLRINSITELRQNASQTNFTKLVELSGWQGGYLTGGNIALYPKNTQSKIDRMKALLNFSVNYTFTVKSNNFKKLPIPSPISTDTYLSSFIDLSGAIGKPDMIKFRDFLPAEDYEKLIETKKLLSEEGDGIFDIVDLFERSKVKITLDLLVNLDKRIEARIYTICSSNKVSPDIISFAVSCLNIKNRIGLFSAYILEAQRLIQADPSRPLYIQAKAYESTMKIPANPNTPVLMIGNGVGIAPMRGFCQESGVNILNKQPNPFGHIAVFFGTRSKSDKLFDADFQTSQKLTALNNYHIAFSREEGQPKQYVQDALTEQKALVVDILKNKAGIVFVCGSTPLKKGVVQTLEKIFKEAGDEEYVQKMIKEGRISFECFGG